MPTLPPLRNAGAAGAVALLGLGYARLVAPWLRRRGATGAEIGREMPGDRIIRAAGGAVTSTVAVTVGAPAERVWPWLVQLGVGRGGFYTLTWVENVLGLGVTNADRIVPEWQHLKTGDVVGIRSKDEGARVAVLEPGHALVLVDEPTPGFVSTWDFGLYPRDEGRTRLVLRRGAAGGDAVGRALNTLLEPGYAVMDWGMLSGIKRRAEAGTPDAAGAVWNSVLCPPAPGPVRPGRPAHGGGWSYHDRHLPGPRRLAPMSRPAPLPRAAPPDPAERSAVMRLFYRDWRPTRLGRWVNGLQGWLSGLGLPPRSVAALEVRGRASGRRRSVPVVIATVEGHRYLVSMLGPRSDWVQNVEAAHGDAVLRQGRRNRVRLVPVPPEQRAPVLREYVRLATSGRQHFPLPVGAPLSEFAAIAARYPVYRIDPG